MHNKRLNKRLANERILLILSNFVLTRFPYSSHTRSFIQLSTRGKKEEEKKRMKRWKTNKRGEGKNVI